MMIKALLVNKTSMPEALTDRFQRDSGTAEPGGQGEEEN